MSEKILDPSDENIPPPIDPADPAGESAESQAQRTLNRSTLLAKAWTARQGATQTAIFSPRDFVTFGLPYKRQIESTYKRRNGPHEFIVTAPEYDAAKGTGGVPFGQDRLVVVFLTTLFKLAGSPKSNALGFPSAKIALQLLGLPQSGTSISRFTQGIARVHGATYLAYDVRTGYRAADRYQLLRRYKFWFDRGTAPNQYSLRPNVLDFDPRFADDIRSGAVPLDLETAKSLKNNLPAFDLYTFQTYRSYLLHREGPNASLEIDVFGESGLLAQLGTTVDQTTQVGRRKARQLIARWHGEVQLHWPDCPNELILGAQHKRERLIVRPAVALTGTALPRIPGVRVLGRDEVDEEFQQQTHRIVDLNGR